MSEQSEQRNVVWRCFCTVWACGTAAMVPVPGGLQITEGAPQVDANAVMAILASNGWARDSMGLLCPTHVDQALRRVKPDGG